MASPFFPQEPCGKYDSVYEFKLEKINQNTNNIGATLKHEPMNRLHRYFEDLQGEVWNLSPYYKLADYKTKLPNKALLQQKWEEVLANLENDNN
jgi:hypothetical protein